MFYKSYTKSEARAFDHLYDPIYTTGDLRRDIQRENVNALTNTAPVNIYTNFNSMFSELPQRPRTYNVLQRNQLPTRAPEINDTHQRNRCNDGDDASGKYRSKFFAIPQKKSGLQQAARNTNLQFTERTDGEKTKQTKRIALKPQLKTRTVSCQTIYREQSAQTKPYLPQIQYEPGVERTELFQFDSVFDIDTPLNLSDIIALNRRRKRLECEKVVKQGNNNLATEKQQIFETLEWQKWLTHENDIENLQSLRYRTVEEKLKQRDKLFENDSIKTIDLSINRLNNEHKRQIETINKKYERSMRKLRKSVYNCAKIVGDKHSNICDTIQKLRHGNLNNSIASASASQVVRKYEMELNRLKVDNGFTINYEQAMHTESRIDRPKKVIYEIMPGFLKDNNLRIVYEALKAYRLQQAIHNEIANKLKSIDKLRAVAAASAATIIPVPVQTSSSHDDGKMVVTWKITEQKNKIAEMLKMLAYLKELLQNVPHISIDSFLDLLMHKFHVIETESSINDLLNLDIQKMVSTRHHHHHHHFNSSQHLHEPLLLSSTMTTTTDDISSAYLNDILRRCSELQQSKKKPNEMDTAINLMQGKGGGREAAAAAEVNDVMRDIWPDIMDRLENYLDNRKKQIKVDLKRLTSEEEAMVKSVRNECVENIIEEICFIQNEHDIDQLE